MANEWIEEFPGSVTLCDLDGIIIAMNKAAKMTMAKEGGTELIGTNLMDCHNPNSQSIINRMIADHQPNIYTIEKHGQHKLIYQSAWTENGEYKGLVEISLPIPTDMPHFVRD
jgi:transcriptional regulator with PAS, ATPase and Fis domain